MNNNMKNAMKNSINWCVCALLTIGGTVMANEKPLDFWEDEIRSIATASEGQHVDHDLAALRAPGIFSPKQFQLDHSDKKVGDLSLIYLPGQVKGAKKVGFVANLWGGKWKLTSGMKLSFQLKTTGTSNPDRWRTILVDEAGKSAVATLNHTDTKGQWQEMNLPLGGFKTDPGFDWAAVKLCEFEADFGADSQVHFDGVCFQDKGSFIGVTDKPISQRMAEAEANREFRLKYAMKSGVNRGIPNVIAAFNKMYLNEDLDKANEMLVEDIKTSAISQDTWSLLTTPLYCRFYYWFSNRAGKYPGRMKPEVEKLLLESIWERTVAKNDIAWSRQSTWWMDGSENHDINAKACNLVSSRIFMNEPEYKDRIYPDYGFGGGYHYGHAGYYGKGVNGKERQGGGRANLKDGKQYNAADHYKAWLGFMKEYFRERARRGFFLENYSDTYTKHTLNMVDLAYQYNGDKELTEIVGDFLTLYWADWAQNSISGIHGGPKTRYYPFTCRDSASTYVDTYLGGTGSGGIWWYWNLVNDYRLPKVVWEMALDRQGMGEFVYSSRGIGEEENRRPRPLGTERSLVCDTESRMLKYTYVTPDYTLGTQMDHPDLAHSHLSTASRWQGMTVAQSPLSSIVPAMYPASKRELSGREKHAATLS